MLALVVFSIGVYGLQYCGAQLVAVAVRPRGRARRLLTWGFGLVLSAAAIQGVPVAAAAQVPAGNTPTRQP